MMKKRIIEIIAALVLTVAAVFLPNYFGESTENQTQAQSYEYTEIQDIEDIQEEATEEAQEEQEEASAISVEEDGSYSTPEEVALYIHIYGRLPQNYITKTKAQKLGWKSESYDLWEVAYGKSIGGGKFGNREGLLPDAEGRTYYECDVNYFGGDRGGERIVYSDDGLIFYSADHYESYIQLY